MNQSCNTPLTLIVLAFTLLTGCDNATNTAGTEDGQTQTAAVAQRVNACDLISKGDAESILGEPVKAAEVSENAAVGSQLCMYSAADEASTRFLQIALTQDSAMPANGVSAASIFQSLKTNFEGTRTDIEDIGDDAFIATGGLHLLRNGHYLNIGAGNPNADEVRKVLLSAGKTAADKL